jgi:tetratricopeptide (TPR) repeat protein
LNVADAITINGITLGGVPSSIVGGTATDDRLTLLGHGAVAIGTGCADDWRKLGLLRKAQGRDVEALELLTRACELAPLDRGARSQRGDVLSLLGRHHEALSTADDTLLLSPHGLQACLRRAKALVALGRHDAAIATYSGALQRHPASLGHRRPGGL